MLWVSSLGLLVSAIALVVLIVYTYQTRRIAQASVEQSEALQKPCVTINFSPRLGEDAILEAPRVAEVMTPDVELLNIGSGPALNVSYEIKQVDVPAGGVQLRPTGFISHLRHGGESWRTPTGRNTLQGRNFEFLAEYESLSGSAYETKIRVENRILVSFHFGKRKGQTLSATAKETEHTRIRRALRELLSRP